MYLHADAMWNFSNAVSGYKEGMLSVTAGLAYKFNRRGFVRASNVQPVDVTPYLDRIRNLEENNTDLASKNSVLNDENEKLRNAPAKVVVEQKVSASPVVLFFRNSMSGMP